MFCGAVSLQPVSVAVQDTVVSQPEQKRRVGNKCKKRKIDAIKRQKEKVKMRMCDINPQE